MSRLITSILIRSTLLRSAGRGVASGDAGALLREDGSFLLREDGSKILRE